MTMLKIEAKGPDNTLRLRQVKVLGYVDAPLMQKQPRAASIQQKNCEAETLRVFRLLTSQVFISRASVMVTSLSSENLFEDHDFPANASSLYIEPEKHQKNIQWLRPQVKSDIKILLSYC